jgi:hypothetical protein
MKIVSRIKKAVSKVVSSVKSAYNKVTGGSQTASLGGLDYNNPVNNALQAKYAANPATNPVTLAYGQNYTPIPTGSGKAPNMTSISGKAVYAPAPKLPVTISAGVQKSGSSGSAVKPGFSSGFEASAFTNPTFSQTISASSLAGSSTSGLSSGGASYTMPSAPTSVNPGKTDTTDLAGNMAGYYTRKDDGTFELVKDEKSDEDIINEKANLYKQVMGEPTDVYDDPEVRQAQEDRRRIKEALLAPTAELNAIIAKQNTDLLNLRKQGAVEGVTETVYGQQEYAINYNAAIRALPLKAHVASLQGDLELAQSYLTELTDMKKEQIKSQHDYNSGLFNIIYNSLEAKEKRQADKLIKENDRAYKQEDELIDYKAEMLNMAYSQKAPINVINAIERATDKMGVARAAGKYATKATEATIIPGENPQLYSGLSTGTATAVRSVVSKYGSEPTIQNFATIQDGYNFAKSIDTKTKNPADDQALIYSLAKTLDPGSVVREGEYATAQKYAQSWVSAYGKAVTQAIAGTGFLSETARTNIKKTIEQKYNSSKISYERQYGEYTRQINDLTGRSDGGKFLRSYVTEGQTGTTGGTTTSSGKPFDAQSAKAAGYSDEEIQSYLNSH